MLVVLAFVLCACGNEAGSFGETEMPASTPTPELTYTEAAVLFEVPNGESYTAKNGQTAEYKGVRYEFAGGLSKTQRDAAVYATEDILSALRDRFGELPEGLSLRVWGYEYAARIQPGETVLNIGCENTASLEHVIGVAQALFGAETNYGLLYALGCDIAAELGYEVELLSAGLDAALALCDEERVWLDMNYACFTEPYTDIETQDKLKSLALAFYDWMPEDEKFSVINDYSDKKYCDALSAFLKEHGREALDNSELWGTVFYDGGEQMLMVWENEYAVFYVRTDYEEESRLSTLPENMANSSYPNLRRLAVDSVKQAEFIMGNLGRFDAEATKADVVFIEKPYYAAANATAEFYFDNPKLGPAEIRMYCTHSFIHEYSHYLLRHMGDIDWRNEMVCYYYQHFVPYPALSYTRYEYSSFDVDADPFTVALSEHIGREVDLSNNEDYALYLRGAVYGNGFGKDEVMSSSYGYVKAAFMKYLVDMAGEEAAVDAVLYDTPEQAFGKSWEELIDEWIAYVNEEFAWLNVSGILS